MLHDTFAKLAKEFVAKHIWSEFEPAKLCSLFVVTDEEHTSLQDDAYGGFLGEFAPPLDHANASWYVYGLSEGLAAESFVEFRCLANIAGASLPEAILTQLPDTPNSTVSRWLAILSGEFEHEPKLNRPFLWNPFEASKRLIERCRLNTRTPVLRLRRGVEPYSADELQERIAIVKSTAKFLVELLKQQPHDCGEAGLLRIGSECPPTAEVANQERERLPDLESKAATQPKKPKRSTSRGDANAKLISALTDHHKYADGGCLNFEPIGNNELARLADVSTSTALEFFKKQFESHKKYKNVYCCESRRLAAALKKLNDGYTVDALFGGTPPGDSDRDDDD